MQKIRLGVVGSGGMATSRMAAFSSLPGAELAGLAARNPATGPPLAQRYDVPLHADWQELVAREDVDAVLVLTHNESHGPIALAALEAGKHVFAEYPLARRLDEGERLVELATTSGRILRLTHSESVSPQHRVLKREAEALGPLMTAVFTRLTPGRGARPEILFNLNISGPPALFFIYQVYPLVDLFGPAAWVEGGSVYEGLDQDGHYQRFANTVTAGFARGGMAQWTWAGGIAVSEAEEYQRLVLSRGTLIREGGGWCRSTFDGVEELPAARERGSSLEELFLDEVRGGETHWQEDAQRALDAIRISLAAEESAREGRRVLLAPEKPPAPASD